MIYFDADREMDANTLYNAQQNFSDERSMETIRSKLRQCKSPPTIPFPPIPHRASSVRRRRSAIVFGAVVAPLSLPSLPPSLVSLFPHPLPC